MFIEIVRIVREMCLFDNLTYDFQELHTFLQNSSYNLNRWQQDQPEKQNCLNWFYIPFQTKGKGLRNLTLSIQSRMSLPVYNTVLKPQICRKNFLEGGTGHIQFSLAIVHMILPNKGTRLVRNCSQTIHFFLLVDLCNRSSFQSKSLGILALVQKYQKKEKFFCFPSPLLTSEFLKHQIPFFFFLWTTLVRKGLKRERTGFHLQNCLIPRKVL